MRLKKYHSLVFTALIISSLLGVYAPVVYAAKKEFKHEIVYISHVIDFQTLTVNFTYLVKNRPPHAISNIRFITCCFGKDRIVEASHPYHVDTSKHRLVFENLWGEEDEDMYLWFVLQMEYGECGVGVTTISIKAGKEEQFFTLVGPACESFYISETPFGVLGAVIPAFVALGLIVAAKKNLIKVSLK